MRYFSATQTFNVRTVVNDKVREGGHYLVYGETETTVSLIVNGYEAKLDRAELTDRGSFVEFTDADAVLVDTASGLVQTRRRKLETARKEAATKLERLERTRQVLAELIASPEFEGVKPQADKPVTLFLGRVQSESQVADGAIKEAEAQLEQAETAFNQMDLLNTMVWAARRCEKLPYPEDVANVD